MTSVPEAPGAPAITLYRQVDRDDDPYRPNEVNYVRIKILTEEGRKYGNVEIAFFRDRGTINGVKGRTIRPDGTIVPFDGKTFDKIAEKSKGTKILVKTFSLPDVQVGSIIEYQYTNDFKQGWVYDSRWILSDELFTKQAKFNLKPNKDFAVRWIWPAGLPAGSSAPKLDAGIVRYEAQNVPAFQTEDYMPPENQLKMRIDFIYTEDDLEKDQVKFWKKHGKRLNEQLESFVGKRKVIEQAAAEIAGAGDAPDVKLRKIYDRVQKLRNTGWEERKTEQEQKREKQKEVKNSEQVWKQGYGDGRQINWVFVALARAAGFQAYSVFISARSEHFFNPNNMNGQDLDGDVVLVKVNGKDIYCDPATKFAPFGLLSWPETGVQGLQLDKDGGTWVTTALPESSVSRIERKANFKLTDTGSLEGKLTLTFSGLEALSRRIEERKADETERKRYLEDELRGYIPAAIEADLTNQPDWDSSSPTLVAEYDLKVPGWVAGAGKRALFPVGLFSAPEKHVFEHANRVHPIYFQFHSKKIDDVTVDLPVDWRVSSMPKPETDDLKACVYSFTAENNQGTLHLTRRLDVNMLLVENKYYSSLRNFFQMVRTKDEQQIVLQPGGVAASN
ncbi:MAG: hypothetical protein NVS9B4_20910 [Candidatus Acidiferrum sp.]